MIKIPRLVLPRLKLSGITLPWKGLNLSDARRRQRFLMVLGATLLVLVPTHLFWLQPLLDQNEELGLRTKKDGAMIEVMAKKVAKSQGLKDELAKLQAGRSDLGQNQSHGGDPNRAAGVLKERFSSLDRANLIIRTYQVKADKEVSGVREISLLFQCSATISGLHRLLLDLERQGQGLFVEELEIRRTMVKNGPDLDVRLSVKLFMEPETRKNQTEPEA